MHSILLKIYLGLKTFRATSNEILLDKEININYKNKMINLFESNFLKWYKKEDLVHLKLITKSLLFTLIPLHNNEKCLKYYNLIFNI